MSAAVTAAAPEPSDENAGPEQAAAVIPIEPRRPRAGRSVRRPTSDTWQTDGALALRTGSPVSADHWIADPPSDSADEAARTAVVVARGLLEVLSGWRPPSQLSRWTSAHLQYDLERRAPRRPTGQRQQLLRVRLSEPSPGVAEVCALTRDLARGRVRVMAIRMERRGGQWIVTRLQAG